MATVDSQIRTRHEAARIAQEEHRRATVLVGVAETTEHVRIRPVLPPLRERVEEACRHGRDDVPRRDGVDADPVLAPFSGQVAGELDDSRLGRVIGTISVVEV